MATSLVAVATDPGLREDSAVCVLQSLVGGLATAMADAGGPATVETGVAGGTPVRLAPPLTMSERRLLATAADGVALSSNGVPWPLASPSCTHGWTEFMRPRSTDESYVWFNFGDAESRPLRSPFRDTATRYVCREK